MKTKDILQFIMTTTIIVITVIFAIDQNKVNEINIQAVNQQNICIDADNFLLSYIENKYYKNTITKSDINTVIAITAKRHRVSTKLIKAIVIAESSYKHKVVSHCGAKGLMQLMPATAKELGVKDSFNPVENIDGGVRYFKMLLNEFDNNITLALASYNAGIGRVKKLGRVPKFTETINYIKRVKQYAV